MKGKVVCFLLLLLVLFIPLVSAEETDESKTCTYKDKAEKRKIASNVKVAYDIQHDENGKYYIDIYIYNIVDDLYVEYSYKEAKYTSSNTYVFPFHADAEGTYKTTISDINNIKKYTFNVHAKGNCSDTLKTLSLTIPKYNSISELEECKYFDVEENIYCQKWITRDFGVDKNTIIKRIEKDRAQAVNFQTTECISCELNDSNYAYYKKLILLRKIIIIALAIGIVIDIVIIVVLKRRIKEASFI